MANVFQSHQMLRVESHQEMKPTMTPVHNDGCSTGRSKAPPILRWNLVII